MRVPDINRAMPHVLVNEIEALQPTKVAVIFLIRQHPRGLQAHNKKVKKNQSDSF
jgi:hypothetical protein